MPIKEPVNEAIDKAVDAAVFVDLVGELGPLIDKAAASARMPVDEAIDEAAMSARMLADEATDVAINAAALVELGGGLWGGPLPFERPRAGRQGRWLP